MKKVIRFVRGKKDEKKEIAGGITPSQSGELISPERTPEDEKILGLENSSGYIVNFISGKDKTLTKLHKAAWQGNLEKLKSAIRKVEVDAGDRHNRTALHYAVVQGHPNIVWFLLGNNAKTCICDDEGCTPLLKAIESGHRECLKLLLDRGADVNVADYTGNSALHVAVKRGSPEIVSGLLERGVATEVSNNLGDYPLHVATRAENKDLVDLLLDSGAEVNVLDRENRTPLMLAAKSGNLALTEVFLERGAHLEIVDSNGWTAEDYALLSGHENVASALKTLSGGKKEEKGEKSQERKPTSDPSGESEKVTNTDSWDESQSDVSERNVTKKVKEFLRKTSKEETETGRKDEDVSDSPSEQMMPPYCRPPRSWEMIQAGMIDENKSGSETKRLSLTTLGTLRSRRESFTEASSTTSPKFTLSLNRRKGAKGGKSFAKQRLSFNEETSLGNWPTNESSKGADNVELAKEEGSRAKQLGIASEKENFQSGDEKNFIPKSDSAEESESDSVDWEETKKADGKKAKEMADFRLGVGHVSQEHPTETETSNSRDSENLPASQAKESNFPPPPTALELGADMAKSLKYMKGISEDRSSGGIEAEGKTNWKTSRETHSLDCLDEINVVTGENRMRHAFKGHFRHQSTSSGRWKSQEMPKCHKPVDRLVDANRRINEQLECYDQALRELAEDEGSIERMSIFEKDSPTRENRSPPSPKMAAINENARKTGDDVASSSGAAPAAPPSPRQGKWENDEKLGLEIATETKGSDGEKSESTEKARNQTERKTKRHILMAMREVKHAIRVPAAFRTPSDDQILSPLTMPEDGFGGEAGFPGQNGPMESENGKTSPDEGNFFFALGRQETVVEKREGKSSGSDTGDEATTWHKNDLRRKDGVGGRENSPGDDSEDEASEMSAEWIQHQRISSFSPLGIIFREIEIENQKEAAKAETEIPPGGISGKHAEGEEEESKGERSPDISLSSGPIEALGTEKDSGSEAESSQNDITPTHQYSLKNQQEWLKCHLKTATTEKNKLEEIAAQLLEKSERLQYELADAKEATKSRDEVIKLLQEQLTRMEAAYTKSLEESVRSKLQLTSHEQEIIHLKEICYKYVEDSAGIETKERDGAENAEALQIRIIKLEEEKEKMKEEIVRLEKEKTSLVKRLKELTESEIMEQCQRWKERCEKRREVTAIRIGGSGDSEDAGEITGSEREKQMQERNLKLEKKLLEMTEENAELRRNLRRIEIEMECEGKIKDARKERNDSVGERRWRNADVEACAKRLEIDEKNERNIVGGGKEVRFPAEVDEKEPTDEKSEETRKKGGSEKSKEMVEDFRDRIGIEKCSGDNANDGPNAELVELKNKCDLMWKSLEEMQSRDRRDIDFRKKADPEMVADEEEDRQVAPDIGGRNAKSEGENVGRKNVVPDLKNQLDSLLEASRQAGTGSDARERQKQEEGSCQRGTTTRRKGVGMEDRLAWSNLYGIKWSERMRGSSSIDPGGWKQDEDGEEKVRGGKESGVDSTETDKNLSLDKLELVRLRREIGLLQKKMSDERAMRRSLEIQMDEINRDLKGKQSLEREVHSLKEKIDRDCVRKFDLELVEYQKELEERREKYLDGVGENSKMSDDDFKAKCEVLAKEREKSKEIKNKIWSKATETIRQSDDRGGNPFPVSQFHHGFSSGSATEPEAFGQPQYLTLEPEIKNQLEKELDRSIRKHKSGSSPIRSTSGLNPNLLEE